MMDNETQNLHEQVTKRNIQRKPLMRFASKEQIVAEYYLIPKDEAEELLKKAITELYGNIADMDASIASSMEILEYIDAMIH